MSKRHHLIEKFKDTKNLLKIVSIFLSIFLWFFVLKSQPVSIKENLTVEFELPEGHSFSRAPVMEIEVYLEGLRATLRRSDIEKSKIRVKVPEFSGESILYVADINRSNIPQQTGVKIKDFFPKKIDLYIEKTLKKKVPIKMNFEGNLPDELIINSYSVSPKEVLISGAKSFLKNINDISTNEIKLTQLNLEDREITTELILPPLVKLVEMENKTVQVNLGITAIKPIKKDIHLPIKFISDGIAPVESSHNEVIVSISYVEGLLPPNVEQDNYGLRVFADVSQSKNGGTIKLEVNHIKNIKILNITPSYISIKNK